MTDKSLLNELAKKFLKDIGATPFSFGKAGLTHKYLLCKKSMRIDDDGLINTIPLWYGEAQGSAGRTCALICRLNDGDDLEVAGILGFKEPSGEISSASPLIGFYYDWKKEVDNFRMKVCHDKEFVWVPMDMQQRLTMNLGFEVMVQEGILWNPSENLPEEFRSNLTEIIEVDEEVEE